MSELDQQLRDYFDSLTDPVDIDSITRRTPRPFWRRPALLAAAAIMVVVGVVALVAVRGSDNNAGLDVRIAPATEPTPPASVEPDDTTDPTEPSVADPGRDTDGEAASGESPELESFAVDAQPSSIAVGHGSVWIGTSEIVDDEGVVTDGDFVQRLDPDTGRALAEIPVPGQVGQMAATRRGMAVHTYTGLGLAERNEGRAVAGHISVIDAATDQLGASIPLVDGDAEIEVYDIAASDDAVWASAKNELLRLDPVTLEESARIRHFGVPRGLVVGPDLVWLSVSLGTAPEPADSSPTANVRLIAVDLETGDVVHEIPTTDQVVAAPEAGKVWVRELSLGTDATGYLRELDPTLDAVPPVAREIPLHTELYTEFRILDVGVDRIWSYDLDPGSGPESGWFSVHFMADETTSAMTGSSLITLAGYHMPGLGLVRTLDFDPDGWGIWFSDPNDPLTLQHWTVPDEVRDNPQTFPPTAG